jgi:5'-methylthioadenosine phosphorylase
MVKDKKVLGVLGGSGVYEIDGLRGSQWKRIESPFGEASDELLHGELDGQDVVFLPRHGRGHKIPPSHVNYRANIDCLKRAGVTDLVSVSAVGSLKEELSPGTFVIIDQFIDRTFARAKSFFGPGCVAHVSMAQPVCDLLGDCLEIAAKKAGIKHVRGGTYLAMEGPQFSSLAESQLYRSWNCDVVGMTNMPEAKLAREAELCYASVAMVTDYDCWRTGHDAVTVEQVVKVLFENASLASSLIKAVTPVVKTEMSLPRCRCKMSLDGALITAPEFRDPTVLQNLDAVAGRVINK